MASPGQVPPTIPPQYMGRRRRSLSGPLILIIMGVFFLLLTSRVITWPTFGHYFARFWPLLLILWGGIRLAEYYSDRAHGYPTRGIGAGGVMLIIFLIIMGMSASTADRVNWQALQGEVDVDDNFFGGMFGQTFTFNNSQEQGLPTNAKDLNLRVLNDRGDVTVNAWDDNKVKVELTKKVRANSQEEASKVDQQTQPTISIDGNVITVNANTTGAGARGVRADVEVWVPKNVAAEISTRNGDISATGRMGAVKANTSRGDITLDDITGQVVVEQRNGDVKLSKITGDVSVDGRTNDTTISDINGTLKLNGDFMGGINVSKVAKTLTFRSSRTDMELARLDGDLTMDGGDLRASKLMGPMRVLTRSKDIHLDDLNGDVRIENANGGVEVHSAKLGTIEITNRKGDVQIVVPEKSNFQGDLRARNGEISSDFSGLKVTSQHDDSSASGNVGNGGPRVQVNNEHGNIEIRKAGAATTDTGKDD